MNPLALAWYGSLSALTQGTVVATMSLEHGKSVLAPAGGDRAQVMFSGLDDLKRFLVERCEAAAR